MKALLLSLALALEEAAAVYDDAERAEAKADLKLEARAKAALTRDLASLFRDLADA